MSDLDGKNMKIGAMDRFFPPIWLLAIAVFLVVTLTVLSGWKILNLENERNQVIQDQNEVLTERRLLERDIKAYSEIRNQLPMLEKNQMDLTTSVANLEGKVRAATAIFEGLQSQASNAEIEREKAKSERTMDEAAAASARKEYASLQKDIQAARNKSQSSEKIVQTLIVQEKALRNNIGKLKNKESDLTANINSLEKEKLNNKKLLEQMLLETGELQKLYKKFGAIAVNLEQTRISANETVQNFKTQSDSFDGTLALLKEQTLTLTQQTENVKNTNESLKSSTESTLQATNVIQSSFEKLDETTRIFRRVAVDAETSTKDLISKAGETSDKLKQQTDSLGPILVNITDASNNILDQINALNLQVSSFDQNLTRVAEATSNYSDTVHKSEDLIADFTTSKENLTEEVSALKKITIDASAHLNNQNGSLIKLFDLLDKKLQEMLIKVDSISKEIENIKLPSKSESKTDM